MKSLLIGATLLIGAAGCGAPPLDDLPPLDGGADLSRKADLATSPDLTETLADLTPASVYCCESPACWLLTGDLKVDVTVSVNCCQDPRTPHCAF